MSARTEKIYETEPYTSRFEAIVVGIDGDMVTLDRTAFYPGGGGQDPDAGTIGGNVVIEVRQKDGTVVHAFIGD